TFSCGTRCSALVPSAYCSFMDGDQKKPNIDNASPSKPLDTESKQSLDSLADSFGSLNVKSPTKATSSVLIPVPTLSTPAASASSTMADRYQRSILALIGLGDPIVYSGSIDEDAEKFAVNYELYAEANGWT